MFYKQLCDLATGWCISNLDGGCLSAAYFQKKISYGGCLFLNYLLQTWQYYLVFSDQQEISTTLPTLFYKSALIIERVKNQKIDIEIHQFKSSLLLHELFNRNEIQLIFGCLENYHKLLIGFRVKGYSCLFFEEISTSWKMVACKSCL